MFDLIRKILNKDNGKVETTEKDAMTAHLALTILMLEAAHADGECSEAEKDHLGVTLEENFGIPRKDTRALVNDRDKDPGAYVDLFAYTQFINENFSEAEKISIVESVWQIILVDNHLEAHEDHFVHKLANLLSLGHGDLIDAKRRARQQLSS